MRPIIFTAEDRRALAHDRYHHPDPRVQRKKDRLGLRWRKTGAIPVPPGRPSKWTPESRMPSCRRSWSRA